MKILLSDWRSTLPLVGLGVVAVTGLYYFLRPKREDAGALERERRTYLNRVGRIVEGQVLDVTDGNGSPSHDSHPALAAAVPVEPVLVAATPSVRSRNGKHEAMVANRHGNGASANGAANGSPKLLFYTYSISGVTYETAQDITGLEEQLHLDRVAAGQTASVKYDPSNPSNSILLADDWSGLH